MDGGLCPSVLLGKSYRHAIGIDGFLRVQVVRYPSDYGMQKIIKNYDLNILSSIDDSCYVRSRYSLFKTYVYTVNSGSSLGRVSYMIYI